MKGYRGVNAEQFCVLWGSECKCRDEGEIKIKQNIKTLLEHHQLQFHPNQVEDLGRPADIK